MKLADELLKLTEKQRLYFTARVQGAIPIDAARVAGYAEDDCSKRAYENERHPRLGAMLKQSARNSLRKLNVTRDDVLSGLLDAVHAAATSTELTMAWRELGKMIGAYEPEVKKVEITHRTAEQMETLSDKELLDLAEEENFTLDGEFTTIEEPDELEALALDDLSEGHEIPQAAPLD